MSRTSVLSIILACLATASTGCIAVGGSTKRPTVGRELADLKMALDRGAVTPAEYDDKKAELLGHRH